MSALLNIYTGCAQGEKLRVCAYGMKKLLKSGKKVVAIVPDQFSFAFDKSLYGQLGAKDFNKVTVLSFKRLSESLIERYGTKSGALLEQPERLILIYLTLRKLRARKNLRLLGRSLDKPAFAADMSLLLDSLRRSGSDPEKLKAASEKLGGTLGDKLSDVSEIYSGYLSALRERLSRDESSVISEGAAIAAEKGEFKGCHVFIDRFDSFSPDELLMIKTAIRDAASVTVNLLMPAGNIKSASSPFAHCAATSEALVRLCAETNTRVAFYNCHVPRTANRLIDGVGGCLYSPAQEKIPADGCLKIYRAENMHEEAELVAAKIRDLVVNGGYSFNEIAVITHDMDGYSQPLEAAFERYGIEAFTDRTQPASGMAMTVFMLDAIEAAATRQPDTEKILKYLRSPFSPLDAEEISALWDYAVRWNVEKGMWLEPFTAGDCAAAEETRKKVMGPILKLHEAARSASAKETAAAFCDFLNDINAAERAFAVIEDCADENMKLETARLFKQLWSAVMNAVSAVYRTAGEEKMTLRAFADLLKLILSQSSLASPPQKLDSVTVADVERSVITEPRVAFVIGLADGLFPADIRKNGLFSGRDIKKLEEEGICFDMSPEARLSGERFDCYKALTAPSERLILSWSSQDLRGRELRPSRFIRRICAYSGAKITPATSLPAEELCSTPAAAYYSCAASRSLTQAEKAAVKEALSDTEYGEKLRRLGEVSGNSHRLSPDISRKLFAGRDINVTASRIDVYNRCNYEYFCKYGLKIEPVAPLAIDPANRGTVMHYLFENVLKSFGSGFSEASDEDIKKLVAQLLKSYSEECLGGDFGKSAKFAADYGRLGGAAVEILLNMREEFKVSKFRPERFEYDLSRENGESALSIPLSRGLRLNVRGVADRVDAYTDESGQKYIRIVDYKTGAKKFSFDDIYNGINLQLLLYMLALTEGRDADFNGCKPAGILYMRAGFLECEADFDPLKPEQKSRHERSAEQLKRNGLIVADDGVIGAMDCTLSGKFVPVKKTASGKYDSRSQIISEKSFRLLEDFARNKTLRFGEDLLNGKIDAIPLGTDPEHLRCAYCDYGSVCDRKKYLYRLISGQDGETLKAMISDGEEG